jgi:hypothetical protein
MQHTGCSLARACDQMHPRGFNLLPGEFYYILISKQCLLLCYTFPWPITLGWVKPLRKRMRLSFSLIKLSRCFIQLVYMSNQFLQINWKLKLQLWPVEIYLLEATNSRFDSCYVPVVLKAIKISKICPMFGLHAGYCEVGIASYAS